MEVVNAPWFRWTAKRYMRFAETDIFVAEDRVELLNGVIVQPPRIGYRHANAAGDLLEFFVLGSNDRYDTISRAPLLLDEWSVPEPDICLIDPTTYSLLKRHPGPEHVYLLIEISEATLAYDRTEKLQAYARQSIADYWILNLQSDVLEVYRMPEGDRYQVTLVYGATDSVSPLAFADLKLQVRDLIS